jgi:hypothetical protein
MCCSWGGMLWNWSREIPAALRRASMLNWRGGSKDWWAGWWAMDPLREVAVMADWGMDGDERAAGEADGGDGPDMRPGLMVDRWSWAAYGGGGGGGGGWDGGGPLMLALLRPMLRPMPIAVPVFGAPYMLWPAPYRLRFIRQTIQCT